MHAAATISNALAAKASDGMARQGGRGNAGGKTAGALRFGWKVSYFRQVIAGLSERIATLGWR